MYSVSIVVRAYNEAKQLRLLLANLEDQIFEGHIELIVVDNGSTDDTAVVAREFGVKVVHLAQSEFSYPKSLNVGIEAAHAPIVLCLVAHAYPDSRHWIAAGVRHFRNPKVAGAFSYSKPYHGASFWDKVLWWPPILVTSLKGVTQIRMIKPGMGVFGATNIVLRKSVWGQHEFDERHGAAGEDHEWAEWAINHGYVIIRDPAFTVRHSHNLRNFSEFRAQLKLWKRSGIKRRFDSEELSFRTRT